MDRHFGSLVGNTAGGHTLFLRKLYLQADADAAFMMAAQRTGQRIAHAADGRRAMRKVHRPVRLQAGVRHPQFCGG